jgi:hypothetical protein
LAKIGEFIKNATDCIKLLLKAIFLEEKRRQLLGIKALFPVK